MAANIRPKSNQHAFDIALTKLRKQGCASMLAGADIETCAYRGENGNRCAIGHMLPNALYSKSLEGQNAYGLASQQEFKEYFSNVDPELLADLQVAHDNELKHGLLGWERAMKKIAVMYNLVYTPAKA